MDFQLTYILPEVILAAGAMLVLVAGLRSRGCSRTPERFSLVSPEFLCLLTLAAALVPVVMLIRAGASVAQFGGMIAVDTFSLFFKLTAILGTGIVVLMSIDYFERISFHRGEFYALLLFATLAICFLVSASDLIMIYISLEFLSITSYVLAGYLKNDPRSNEAAVKYFLYGSIAAAVMLYGMSILYGLTGATNIAGIGEAFRLGVEISPLMKFSLLLVLVGFGFKTSMVPFHQWAPDTYEGSPTPVAAFLSVGSKAAGFAVLIRALAIALPVHVFNWVPIIIVISGVTMTVGNLIAIPQTNIKRMLAYSSIAQAGYLLLGVAAMPYTAYAVRAVVIYVFIYLFMNLGAFAVVTILSSRLKSDDIQDYAGLIKRSPFAAVAMVFFLLSLAGIPPTAGFVGKLYLFFAVIDAGTTALLVLAIVAIINTVISIYYYMNIARQMFFTEPESAEPVRGNGWINFAVGAAFAMTLIVLIYPQPFIELARTSARILMTIP